MTDIYTTIANATSAVTVTTTTIMLWYYGCNVMFIVQPKWYTFSANNKFLVFLGAL